MTKQEHLLMIEMFAFHYALIRATLHKLEDKGILERSDLKGILEIAYSFDPEKDGYRADIRVSYGGYARVLGLELPPDGG